MFTPLQRTLKFTCECLSIYTRRQSFLEVFHSFSHSSIHLFIHHTFTEHLLCAKHCSRCQGFLSKTKIWPRHSTSSMTSHCQVQTPAHTRPVLACILLFMQFPLSGWSLLVMKCFWDVLSSLKLSVSPPCFPSLPHAATMFSPLCSHCTLYHFCYSTWHFDFSSLFVWLSLPLGF